MAAVKKAASKKAVATFKTKVLADGTTIVEAKAAKGQDLRKLIKPRTVARSAKSVELVSKAFAKANPDTTVVETTKKEKPKRKPFKLPKSLAQCADLAYNLREERLSITRDAEVVKKEETQVKEYLIKNLPKSNASGVSGATANAKIDKKEIPTIEDKKKLIAHVKKTGDWDLLTIGLNTAAVEARWEQKKKVPGVGKFDVIKVSLTKVR